DQRGDAATSARWTPTPFFGGPTGVTAGPPVAAIDVEGDIGTVGTAGDVNGDGYADVVLRTRFSVAALFGGALALTSGTTPGFDGPQSFFALDGDLDADRFSDAASTTAGVPRILVSPGSAGGFSSAEVAIDVPPAETPLVGALAIVDANGDGFADLAVTGQ